ncbi:hypothetical protein [Pseudomonas sp. ACN5]|uniref:hypothetical protein n=1 Tax=Pseudomonas sp. ACN5 TaxID=1920427 RepID=UPI000BB34C2E|nr:hypothetical protein [Pseudomonas sp. ACN5]
MAGNRIKGRDSKGPQIKARQTNAEADDSDLKPPVFSFEHLQKDWCIQDCQQEERSKMLDKLRRLSSLSWREIRQQDRHGLGTEIIARNSINPKIPSFLTDDVNLLAFRVIDKAPMVGYRKGRVFHVIWIDRGFTLYDHG